jgi:hypothetical protein
MFLVRIAEQFIVLDANEIRPLAGKTRFARFGASFRLTELLPGRLQVEPPTGAEAITASRRISCDCWAM